MYPEDTAQFLHDELYGEEWSEHDLERMLGQIFAFGRGFVDPALFVSDDSWLRQSGRDFGFVQRADPMRQYAECPLVSAPADATDLLSEFLRRAQE